MEKALFILLLFCASCVSTRSVMTSWIGHTKHEVILQWGAGYSTADDGGGGEIITYSSTSVYYIPVGGVMVQQPSNTYRSFYINSEGKVYRVSWNN